MTANAPSQDAGQRIAQHAQRKVLEQSAADVPADGPQKQLHQQFH